METYIGWVWDSVNRCRQGEPITLEWKLTDVPRSGQTQSGYGPRLPTGLMVKHNGKWRRVYVACWSNAGTCYIGKRNHWEMVIS